MGKAARKKVERRARGMEKKLTFTIMVEKSGKIGVTGPLDNEFLCYGLLEKARQVVQTYATQHNVQPPEKLTPAVEKRILTS